MSRRPCPEEWWKVDEPQIMRIADVEFCYDCHKHINTRIDTYLKSHPNIFRTRYRCESCGIKHQKFMKLEFREQWYTGRIKTLVAIYRYRRARA